MVVVNISEAKAQLSALIAEVRKGKEVIVAKAGQPVAKIVPYEGAIVPGLQVQWLDKSGLHRISMNFPMISPKRSECGSHRVEDLAGHRLAALVDGW